jgi:flagellar motor switch protein FliN/FliY
MRRKQPAGKFRWWNSEVGSRRQDLKADLDLVPVELTVVLGSTQMPIYKLLRSRISVEITQMLKRPTVYSLDAVAEAA